MAVHGTLFCGHPRSLAKLPPPRTTRFTCPSSSEISRNSPRRFMVILPDEPSSHIVIFHMYSKISQSVHFTKKKNYKKKYCKMSKGSEQEWNGTRNWHSRPLWTPSEFCSRDEFKTKFHFPCHKAEQARNLRLRLSSQICQIVFP